MVVPGVAGVVPPPELPPPPSQAASAAVRQSREILFCKNLVKIAKLVAGMVFPQSNKFYAGDLAKARSMPIFLYFYYVGSLDPKCG